jgi:hypothetical protein
MTKALIRFWPSRVTMSAVSPVVVTTRNGRYLEILTTKYRKLPFDLGDFSWSIRCCSGSVLDPESDLGQAPFEGQGTRVARRGVLTLLAPHGGSHDNRNGAEGKSLDGDALTKLLLLLPSLAIPRAAASPLITVANKGGP